MTHGFYDCIIIICPLTISTDRVVMSGGHGKLQTKRNYVFKHSCTIYSHTTSRQENIMSPIDRRLERVMLSVALDAPSLIEEQARVGPRCPVCGDGRLGEDIQD